MNLKRFRKKRIVRIIYLVWHPRSRVWNVIDVDKVISIKQHFWIKADADRTLEKVQNIEIYTQHYSKDVSTKNVNLRILRVLEALWCQRKS
jgi:hypothetical protein